MKVDTKTLAYIQNIVETASLVKIEDIIIEPDKVRAINEERAAVLFQNTDVPTMPFKMIGLSRIETFKSRFEIAKTMDQFEVEAEMDEKDKFARALVMKGKGFKIDYRCANPETMQDINKIPKTLTDTVKFKVKMTPEAVLLMSKGVTAMTAEDVAFIGTKDGVSFEMEDVNHDVMTYKFADKVNVESSGTAPQFNYKYPIKYLLGLFKQHSDDYFYLTSKGMIKIAINGLDIFILPRV